LPGLSESKIVDKQRQGFWLNIALGIVGALVGGFLFDLFGASGVTGLNIYSMIVAIVGSIVVLLIYNAVTSRSTNERAQLQAMGETMAGLEDMIRSTAPGGNIGKPLLIALLALLASGARRSRWACCEHKFAADIRRRGWWPARRIGRVIGQPAEGWAGQRGQFLGQFWPKSAGVA
jgi:uncharacterized membrane protein YeaQ/YmgE (transglycosylase-associated protein family)